jgi:ankyrin repeat protein
MPKQKASRELIDGIENNIRPIVQKYLDNGIDPNLRNHKDPFHQGRQLLTFAAIHGHVQIVELLLQHGAHVDGLDFHRRTALSWAAEYCQYDTVKVLVEHGANVNTEDAEWTTPLGWLIHAGRDVMNDEIRKYLVSKGAREELHHTSWDRFKHSVASDINWIFFQCLKNLSLVIRYAKWRRLLLWEIFAHFIAIYLAGRLDSSI